MPVEIEREKRDPEELSREWTACVPAPLRREAAVSEAEWQRLASLAARGLDSDAPEALAEAEAVAYHLAQRVIPAMGMGALLTEFRDALTRCLASHLPEPRPEEGPAVPAQRLASLLNRVNDGFWRAQSEILTQTVAQHRTQSMEQELRMAKRIQQRLLPKSIPQIHGYDIAGRVLPALEVGGDYWSVKDYPEDGIVTFKLADVTGHGVAAAMLVGAVKFISGGFYRGAKTAAQVMERTNHVLVKETPSEIMVSMLYGWLYPLSHDMTLVNAGHETVFLYRSGQFETIPPTGLVLGLLETRYAEVRVHLNPGDLLFACSDGVTDPGGVDPLGTEGVKALVARHAEEPARDLTERVLDAAVERYGHPRDDMSLIVIRRTE
jgi:hypothetical protein